MYIYVNRILRILSHLLFNSYFYSKLRKRHHVVVCGDSHASVFGYIQKKNLLNSVLFELAVVGGATAQGMVNPNSRTDALNIFLKRIHKMKKWQKIFFELGEVDCGFVIWYYAEKFNISVDEQMYRSLNNYRTMLMEVKKTELRSISVISAPLPTIKDGQTWGEVANARKEIKANLFARTNLTLKYNLALKGICDEINVFFIDATTELLDDHKKVIDDKFINSNVLDHHLNNKMYSDVIIKALCLSNNMDKKWYQ